MSKLTLGPVESSTNYSRSRKAQLTVETVEIFQQNKLVATAKRFSDEPRGWLLIVSRDPLGDGSFATDLIEPSSYVENLDDLLTL